jgi:drug/metabolite transporter (DMT)-like permease
MAVHLVMLLHSAISAVTYLAAKRALGELSPFEVALARFGMAALLYLVVLLLRPVSVTRRDRWALLALGLVAIPLNQGLFLTGLARTTPGHAALLYALTPIFVFLLARWRLGERATVAKAAGIGLAFAGVVVVLGGRGLLGDEQARQGLTGDLLVLLAVLAWSVYAVWSKIFAERYGVLAATGTAVTYGTLAYLPAGLLLSDAGHFARLSPWGWASLLYLVVFTSFIAYLLYAWSLRRAEASRVAIWSNVQPVLTAILAWAIYGEVVSGAFLVGGAMVIAGVILTERG